MRKPYHFLSILFCAFLPILSNAQITVVPGATAAALAAKLTGPGVVIMSPTLTCLASANGTFSGISTLSFDSGIVLTNGSATATANPASFFTSNANGTPGDPSLTALAGQPTYDACVLEFNFKPAGDTIKFNYVFGSEEYTSFTCTVFNDVFGFLISGPGYPVPKNLALIPGTSIPVCINSVNCGPTGGGSLATCAAVGPGSPFCAYYVNNSVGTTIVYDGLTTTLTAVAPVTPCDTYHLKIGVADASDEVLDSGVFLEAGSLTSTGIHIAPQGINPTDSLSDQYCVRGCLPGKFIFTRSGNLADSLVLHFVIGGSAVNGYDYSTIADSLIMHIGDSTETLSIYGLVVPPVGPKVVELYILAPYTCGGAAVVIDSAMLTIIDSFYININTSDTAICIGQHVHINSTGEPHLVYSWAPTSAIDSTTSLDPTVSPTVTTTYTVAATFPGTGCAASHDQITVTVYVPPTLDIGNIRKTTCLNVPLHVNVDATPTGIPYTYVWTPTTYLDDGLIQSPTITPGVVADEEYYVTVNTPVPGCNSTDSFLLHVLPNDFSLISADTGVCYPPNTYQIRADGSSEFSYYWNPINGVSDPTSLTPSISPRGTLIYTVTGTYPGCPNMVHTILYSIEHPEVNIFTEDTTFCITVPILVRTIVTPTDSPYTFTWTPGANLLDSNAVAPYYFSEVPGDYKYVLTVKSGLGCWAQDSVVYHARPPIHITNDPDKVVIKYGDHVQLNAINLTTDLLFYSWLPNDGTLDNSNINNPVATPLNTTIYTAIAMNEWGCRDSSDVTVNVDFAMSECIPSAFTPNNDGLNDVFRLCSMNYQKLVEFNVYNRWGQLVFHNATDPKKGWDGTFNGVPQETGVYNYLIVIARPDGTNINYKGEVTLIR